MTRPATAASLLAAAALALVAAAPPDGSAAAVAAAINGPVTAKLTGTVEIPSGDPDGTGVFTARLNDTQDELCYELKVDGIEQASAAHIHSGVAGQSGPPVVPLQAPANGVAAACATVTADLAIRLMQKPESFYVNVHNAAFPTGAVRGQLTR